MLIFAATISTKHGNNLYLAGSEAQLTAKIAAFCDEWWDDATNTGDGPDPKPEGDQALIDAYFDEEVMGQHEYVEMFSPEDVDEA